MHVSHAYFLSLTRTMFVDDIGKKKNTRSSTVPDKMVVLHRPRREGVGYRDMRNIGTKARGSLRTIK